MIRPARTETGLQRSEIRTAVALGELPHLPPPETRAMRAKLKLSPARVGPLGVTNEPDPFVPHLPGIDVLRDVFANILRNPLSGGLDRQKLCAPKTILASVRPPERPLRAQLCVRRGVNAIGGRIKVKARPHVPSEDNKEMVVDSPTFHPFHHADVFNVAMKEDMRAKGVIATGRFLSTGDVISEGERQKSNALDAVNPTKPFDVLSESKSGLSMGRGQCVDLRLLGLCERRVGAVVTI